MDHNQKPPSKRFLSKQLLLSDTSWHEQNLIHVEKQIKKVQQNIAKTYCALVIFTRKQPIAT